MGIRVVSLRLSVILVFCIFSCFRRVLGLLCINFNLFCFVFSKFKERALFPMYQHIYIWKYYDMVVSIVSRVCINCS